MSLDFNKLARWACYNDLSLSINGISNISNYAEIEVRSIYPLKDETREYLFMKKCSDVDYFMQQWELENRK